MSKRSWTYIFDNDKYYFKLDKIENNDNASDGGNEVRSTRNRLRRFNGIGHLNTKYDMIYVNIWIKVDDLYKQITSLDMASIRKRLSLSERFYANGLSNFLLRISVIT